MTTIVSSKMLELHEPSTGSRSTGLVHFKYKDVNNKSLKTEVREDGSCPFCYMQCGSFKGLQLHLDASHGFFQFEFTVVKEIQTVNVSVKVAEVESLNPLIAASPCFSRFHKPKTIMFCSSKRRLRGGRRNARRLNVSFLPLDSPSSANGLQNGVSLLNAGKVASFSCELAGQFGMRSNTAPAIGQSSMGSGGRPMLATEAAAPAARAKKLSAERSEARSHLLLQRRQFYHSHRVQPMSVEQVMSDRDSEDEVDDDVADFEDRQMLDDFVDVDKEEKKFMHLWNTFVRKQSFFEISQEEIAPKLTPLLLWNHGLVDPAAMDKCNSILEKCYDECVAPGRNMRGNDMDVGDDEE
ncbi:unnamed protein product [Thlaspi arvense]|uniref:Polycomb protein VEFS-Box domain-containing protein n=1 Tax=Thlaspi arvense TaxID=13288 RepID=A0AAU9T1U8_THLAR|nr:unnamed protein product [Thlaspi arvense]